MYGVLILILTNRVPSPFGGADSKLNPRFLTGC